MGTKSGSSATEHEPAPAGKEAGGGLRRCVHGAFAHYSPTVLLYAGTLLLSAALIFIVEPMFAKMVLPLLGGAPAVWNTCLAFYQAALLGGYLYAHLTARWLGPRRQAVLHLGLLLLSLAVLPVHVWQGWLPPVGASPVGWLWMLMIVSLGLPFLVVSASAPMLQSWFARTGGKDSASPYFLYAASNLGSMVALLGYPLLIETTLTLDQQSWSWSIGYGFLIVLVGLCALKMWRERGSRLLTAPANDEAPGLASGDAESGRPTIRRKLHWLVLSFVPSSLLLGVTTFITSDLMAIPLLWIIPLTLYLLTFVAVFARHKLISHRLMVRIQPFLILAASASFVWHANTMEAVLLLGVLHLAAFFITAMVCHGELYARRPSKSYLTEFYLWMSLGGVLGGLFNALVAPVIFSSVLEYPLMIVAALLLRPAFGDGQGRLVRSWRLVPAAVLAVCVAAGWAVGSRQTSGSWFFADIWAGKLFILAIAAVAAVFLRARPIRMAVAAAGVLAVATWFSEGGIYNTICRERTFFGVLRVIRNETRNVNVFYHGATMHGRQCQDPSLRREPWSYYHRNGPLGSIFKAMEGRRRPKRIGVLGLGIGAMAAYGRPDQRITFYEIDPAVERIARDTRYFTYLSDSQADVEVILGDARLSLVNGPPRMFDLLVVDVYSSDAVPAHLMTREAMAIFLGHLSSGGLLAAHISSRFLNLQFPLADLAQDANLVARVSAKRGYPTVVGQDASVWVVMARRREDLGRLAEDPRWGSLQTRPGRLWTDDFSNIIAALDFELSLDAFAPRAEWAQPEEATDLAQYAAVLWQAGRMEESLKNAQKAVDLAPDNAEARCALALALEGVGRPDDAESQMREAERTDPHDPQVRYQLGALLAKRGKYGEAITHYRKALEGTPRNPDIYNKLGVAFESTDQLNEAAECYRKALEINPLVALPAYNLGNVCAKQGDLSEAASLFRRALRIDPDMTDARFNLAAVLVSLRQLPQAAEQFRRVVEDDPHYVRAHRTLAHVLVSMERLDLAIKQLRKAVELNPADQSLRRLLDAALAQQAKQGAVNTHHE